MSLEEWGEEFRRATISIADMDTTGSVSYETSAERLRSLVKTRLLLHTDINTRPERFFLAHRLLAEHAHKLGPGFWIRFTVHYNLCVGTVCGLGNDKQVADLADWQSDGSLGCFSLTEKFAGVNSGFIVNTTADWDAEAQEFVLHGEGEGAKKNWISQGLVAEKTVVVADLRMGGKSFGPHAFVMNLREGVGAASEVVPGVAHGDMGRKTVGNDLDNAWIGFDHLRLPKSALLNRYATIDSDSNAYVQHVKGMPVFHMIGQRLFTGRVAVAQGALTFTNSLFETTRVYTDNKSVFTPAGNAPLSSIPQLKHLYIEAADELGRIGAFVTHCEELLTVHLKAGTLPELSLIEAIATAKVMAVDRCIYLSTALKNECGSYALMANTGFEQMDFLLCCKFAEGDSRILMQKMARDRMKLFSKNERHSTEAPDPAWTGEEKACHALQSALTMDAQEGVSPQDAWDNSYKLVYALAAETMDRIMRDVGF